MKKNQFGVGRSLVTRLLSSESGSVTIETLIWLPIFVVLLLLVTETAMVFGGETRVLHVIQDANRLYASGYFQTAGDTETFIRNELPQWSNTLSVSTTESNKIIRTIVTVPVTTLTNINAIPQFSGIKVTIASEQMSES